MANPQLLSWLQQAGFKGPGLNTMAAIIQAESGGNPRAFNGNAGTGDRSYGLAQINMLGSLGPARLRQYGLSSNEDLFDPLTNLKVAYRMSGGGQNFQPWSTYKTGAYKKYLGLGAGSSPGSPQAPVVSPPPGPPANLFADAIKQGRWRLGKSTLADTAALISSSHFNNAYRGATTQDGYRYPKLKGKIDNPAQARMVAEAYKWIGTPYSWAGGGSKGPSYGSGRGARTKGFDCSGLAQRIWAVRGVNIPRVTYDQWRAGKPVAVADLQPGDLVFFHPGPRGPEHVGIAVGGGKFIEAPRTGLNVRISSLKGRKDFLGARRYA